jgi:hypothetical protein
MWPFKKKREHTGLTHEQLAELRKLFDDAMKHHGLVLIPEGINTTLAVEELNELTLKTGVRPHLFPELEWG